MVRRHEKPVVRRGDREPNVGAHGGARLRRSGRRHPPVEPRDAAAAPRHSRGRFRRAQIRRSLFDSRDRRDRGVPTVDGADDERQREARRGAQALGTLSDGTARAGGAHCVGVARDRPRRGGAEESEARHGQDSASTRKVVRLSVRRRRRIRSRLVRRDDHAGADVAERRVRRRRIERSAGGRARRSDDRAGGRRVEDHAALFAHRLASADGRRDRILAKIHRRRADGLTVGRTEGEAEGDALEKLAMRGAAGSKDPRTQAFEDMFWALVNSSEFVFNH